MNFHYLHISTDKKVQTQCQFKNGPTRHIFRLFFVYFQSFRSNDTFLQQINVKNVHPVSDDGIRTQDLLIMSLLPQVLDKGFCPYQCHFSKDKNNCCLLMTVAQLVERSLPTPEVRRSNPVIGKLYITNILSTVLKRRNRGQEWPINFF